MGFFSKEECNLCGAKVGFLSRKTLVNKSGYICKECEKKCSFLINVSQFTPEGIKEHISYMEKQNKIYKEAYEVLDKKKKERHIHSFRGLIFADDIAMFEVVDPKGDKKVYKELFRYDQIENYKTYNVANNDSQNGKKYSEVGVIINLKSSVQDVFGSNNRVYAKAPDVHPYVNELKIPTGKDVNDLGSTNGIIDKLDKLFNRYEDRSLLGNIKSSFTGTEKEKRQREHMKNVMETAGSMLKAKITKNEGDIEKAQEKKQDLKEATMNLAFDNRPKYSQIANDVEKRILGE